MSSMSVAKHLARRIARLVPGKRVSSLEALAQASGSPSELARSTARPDNPYLDARRSINDQHGKANSDKRIFQMLAALALLVALVAVASLAYVASQSKFIPYVYHVDNLGRVAAVGPLEQTSPVSEQVITREVSDFITDARTVTPDRFLQSQAVYRVYAKLTPSDSATSKMNEWMNSSEEANPFERAKKEMVNVDILTTIRQSESAFQVDWAETTRERNGALRATPTRMRALLTIYIAPPTRSTKDEQMRKNPAGVFVKDFSWSRQIEAAK